MSAFTDLLCCCCRCEERDTYKVDYTAVETNDEKGVGQGSEGDGISDKNTNEMERTRVTTVRRSFQTSSISTSDKNANAAKDGNQTKESGGYHRVTQRVTVSLKATNGNKSVVDEKRSDQVALEWQTPSSSGPSARRESNGTEKGRTYVSSYTIQGTTGPEVVTVSEDRRKIDLPDWFLPNQTSKKENGAGANLERSFAGMFDVKKNERSPYEYRRKVFERNISPTSKKVDQPALNLHELDTIQRSDQVTVESQPPSASGSSPSRDSNGTQKGTTGPEVVTVSEDRRKIDLPDWFLPNQTSRKDKGGGANLERSFAGMFDVKKNERSPHEYRRKVFERKISPTSKNVDQPALNLNELDAIQRSDQVTVESQPPSASGPSLSRDSNAPQKGTGPEVVTVSEDRRKIDLPDWFLPNQTSKKENGAGANLELSFAGMFDVKKNERSPYEYRRKVFERNISPTSKKVDQPALNLHELDTIQRSDQVTVESQPPSASGSSPSRDSNGTQKGTTGPEVVTVSEDRRKIDLPDWFLPNQTSRKDKGGGTNLERSFAGMFDVKKNERSPHEYRRKVFERKISPTSKNVDQPALNLNELDAIQRSDQVTVESQPPSASGLSPSRDSNAPQKGTGPEVVTVSEDRRKIDLPDWFLPNQTSKKEKGAGVNLELSFAGMFDVKKNERSPHEYRRKVFERNISPTSKKVDQPALNLNELDTIQRNDQVTVELQLPPASGPSPSNATQKGRSHVSSHSGPDRNQVTEAGIRNTTKPSKDANEEVIAARAADSRKIDIPSWLLPNRGSKPAKRFGRHTDIELQFSDLIKAEKKEAPNPKGTEIFEEIYPVKEHKESQFLFLESLEGDHRETRSGRDAGQRKRERPLDDKLFDFAVPDNPSNKRSRETRRAVYERSIAAESKKTDQPALDLNQLDTLMQRSKQTPEEPQTPQSSSQAKADGKKQQNEAEREIPEDNDDDDDDDDDDEGEEIIIVELNRRLRLPKWFVPHEKKEPKSLECLDELLLDRQASTPEQYPATHAGTEVDEGLLQESISHRNKPDINLHHLLRI